MPNIPNNPSGIGARQQRAAELRADAERSNRMSSAPATETAESPAPAEDTTETCLPVGQGDYIVKEGDCISSIAVNKGHFWETIWNDGGNTVLKKERKDPNVLLPGDHVAIPEKEQKKESGASEMRHCFKRRGEPTKLRLQVLNNNRPVANQPYELTVEGEVHRSDTDAEGKIEVFVPGSAKRARLVVGTAGQQQLHYVIMLGDVDPIASVRGVQVRLNNLGFRCVVDGIIGPETRGAIRAFQRKNQLTESGEADESTRAKLQEQHGC